MGRIWQGVVVLGVVALLGLVSISAGDPSAVTIQLFQFKPTPVEVKVGTRVTWTNQDDIVHTVTWGTPGSSDGRFDSPLDGKGATASVTFTQPGTYDYFCSRHPSMRGEIRVN